MLKNAFYIALFAVISWGSYQISYPSNTSKDLFYDGVFFENVIEHVEKLTKGPRAVGDYYHDDVRRYLIKQLQTMGLTVSIQKSTSFNPKHRTAAPIRNIIATYSGSGNHDQALLLLSHYDAAKFSGKGAGDDASGVAVVLETINALLKSKPKPINDIVVLITDAEEVGLLGAHAFINEQLRNHNIGLIINLEARGSSGPSMMWPETDGGNRAMIEGFAAADVPLPVSTSLHYEIYKMLPNDTDLSPFNQVAKINGFNFAFIDDHFNYHTQRDSLENLSLNTLAHQTFQIHSMLKYFSRADLSQMKATDSMVYFSLPVVGFISYPSWFTWLAMGVLGLTFITLVLTAIKRKESSVISIIKGMAPIIISGSLSFGWCWLLLKIGHAMFPEFNDIMQGFPYSGHHIIAALLVSSAFIVVTVYSRLSAHQLLSTSIANNLLWISLLLPLIYFLPGSGLLIWPVVLSIVLLATQLYLPKAADGVATIFAVGNFILLGTLIINLPIALGINALPVTAVSLSTLLGLFAPMFNVPIKYRYSLLLILLPLVYLSWHFYQQPSISHQHPHPTSLSYLYDQDSKEGFYFNYDVVDSGWNSDVFENTANSEKRIEFRNKYKKPVRNLSQLSDAIVIDGIVVEVKQSNYVNGKLRLELTFTANSNTEVLEIFTNEALTLYKLSIENRQADIASPMLLNQDNRLLQYYFDGNKQINLMVEIDVDQSIDWQIQSHTVDLLNDERFDRQPRPKHQIQKPFIKSDNTLSVQSFTFGNDE